MLTKKGFITAFTIAAAAIWLIGFSIADAQQNPPNPVNKSTSPTPTPAPTPDDEVIKVDTEVVNVLFTAQDRNRRLLTDLKQGDIRLLEDGQAQELIAFSRQVDLPLSLAILIGTSGSQARTLPEEKAAASWFLESGLRPGTDRL